MNAQALLDKVMAAWPGARVVDVRVPPAAIEGATYAGPRANYSLGDLAQLARDEACRIDTVTDVLASEGLAPDAGQLAKRDQFEALARLCERVRADPAIIERLKRAGGGAE